MKSSVLNNSKSDSSYEDTDETPGLYIVLGCCRENPDIQCFRPLEMVMIDIPFLGGIVFKHSSLV